MKCPRCGDSLQKVDDILVECRSCGMSFLKDDVEKEAG